MIGSMDIQIGLDLVDCADFKILQHQRVMWTVSAIQLAIDFLDQDDHAESLQISATRTCGAIRASTCCTRRILQ